MSIENSLFSEFEKTFNETNLDDVKVRETLRQLIKAADSSIDDSVVEQIITLVLESDAVVPVNRVSYLSSDATAKWLSRLADTIPTAWSSIGGSYRQLLRNVSQKVYRV